MDRVALDFGGGQGAKCSVDIRSDLGQASNAGQRQNQRNRRRREAEGRLASSLGRHSPLKGMRLPRSLPSAVLPLRATHSSFSTVSLADAILTAVHNNCLASDKRRVIAC
jgi:hypothetical protein